MNEQELISCANDLLEGYGCGLQDLEGAGSGDVCEALRRNLGHCQHLNESARSHHEEIRDLNNIRFAYQRHEARRYNEAIEEYRKELEKDPNSLQAHLGLGEVYVKQGSYEEAVAEMVKARPLVNLPRQLARIGYVYAAAGKKDEATRILNEVKGQTREHYNLATFIAAIYAELGDKEQAFAWLGKSCDEHQNGVKEFKVSPRFDTVRSDPRFTDLLRRVKLAQ